MEDMEGRRAIHTGDNPKPEVVIEVVAKLTEENWSARTKISHGTVRGMERTVQGWRKPVNGIFKVNKLINSLHSSIHILPIPD